MIEEKKISSNRTISVTLKKSVCVYVCMYMCEREYLYNALSLSLFIYICVCVCVCVCVCALLSFHFTLPQTLTLRHISYNRK